MNAEDAVAPQVPASTAARELFGPRFDLAQRFADLLATVGLERGLIGPRESTRLWDRHLVNSALVGELIPPGVRVVDVGSGAGLPGIPLAIRRPDLRVDLVEPMQRRVDFLAETVAELNLDPLVRVVRGRADDAQVKAKVGNAEWVVSRAVAPLDRLVRWCLPLLRPGGQMLAIKGVRAQAEADQHAVAVHSAGGDEIRVQQVRGVVGGESTWVIVVRRQRSSGKRGPM